MKSKVIDPARTAKRLRIIAVFTFVISPLCSWMSVIATDETAVFASLSRMIWFSGSAMRIFIAMLVLFVPMILSFFLALDLSGITRTKVLICRLCLILSCIVLYVGAMELMPASGEVMTRENIWHGILSFGGMLMIFLTYCLYAFFIRKKDRDGVFLLVCLLVFSLITSAFSVLNMVLCRCLCGSRTVCSDNHEPCGIFDILSGLQEDEGSTSYRPLRNCQKQYCQ